MQDSIIEIRGLSKKYRISHQGCYLAFRDSLAACLKKPFEIFSRRKQRIFLKEDFWALRDVSFDVKKGEVIGVIGRNGAGKTTLLKILSRITYPTEGMVRLCGRVGSLLEVGTGFHPELTGRENIYFNGAILGMRKKEIEKKFDEIVGFSGVEKFLDTPVKRFSSGMQVRLAFSVAAHLEPEILLVDEVLAVGDAQFQKKCLGKMEDISRGGRTVLFVSHNMNAIRALCKRTILLESGRVCIDSATEEAVGRYLNQNLSVSPCISERELAGRIEGIIRKNNPTLLFKKITLLNGSGLPCNSFQSNEKIVISVSYECLTEVFDLRLILEIVDDENKTIMISENSDDPNESGYYTRRPGEYISSCVIPPNIFGQRRFYITVHLVNLKTEHLTLNKILMFDVIFQGYNMHYGEYGDVLFRPQLPWVTRSIEGIQDNINA